MGLGMRRVVDSGRKKVNQLHSVISNRDVNLNAHRLFLLSVMRHIVYSMGVKYIWEGNKTQAATVMLGGVKCILGCS